MFKVKDGVQIGNTVIIESDGKINTNKLKNTGSGSGLDADKLDGAHLDTVTSLGTSNTKVPSQAAVKSYADSGDASTLSTAQTYWTADQGGTNIHAGNYTNTTYSPASSGTLGLVKIGFAESGNNYPVELSSDKMYVNVPWTNTTYSAGTGVGVSSSGVISIGQAVATDSDVTFDDVVVAGNLTVNGTTTTVATTNMVVSDKLIELANGASGSPSGDLGLVFERGSSANTFIGWDESADKFTMGTGTFTGASTGNLTITKGTLVVDIEGDVTGDVTGDLTGNADSADIVTRAVTHSTLGSGTAWHNTTGGNTPHTTSGITCGSSRSQLKLYGNYVTIEAVNAGSGKIFQIGHDVLKYNGVTIVDSNQKIPSSVLPEATATAKGAIELFSNTDQAQAATAVSNTASRTYGLQLNSAGQGVINVPWSDNNTNKLTTFVIEDGDGTEVTMSHNKEMKFVEGNYIDVNWTDISSGSDGDPYDLTISHKDTSTQSSVNNSARTYIQDITLDGAGHVTGLTSASETVTNTNYYLNGISKSGNILTFSVNGSTNQTYTFGSNAFNSTAFTTNTGDITSVAAGTLLDGGGTSGSVTLNVDLSELTDGTGAIVGTSDELVYLDSGVQKRKLISEITLSDFSNDSGWTNDQTAAEILTAIKTVDGSGSGLDADLLDGHQLTTASTGSTVVERDGSGDINARLFRSEYDSTNATINFVMTQIDTVSNNYMRPSTMSQLRNSLLGNSGTTSLKIYTYNSNTPVKTIYGAGS